MSRNFWFLSFHVEKKVYSKKFRAVFFTEGDIYFMNFHRFCFFLGRSCWSWDFWCKGIDTSKFCRVNICIFSYIFSLSLYIIIYIMNNWMELKVLWEFQSLNAWPCAFCGWSGSSPGRACAGEWKHSSLGRRALEGTTLLISVAPRVISLANMAHLWFQSSKLGSKKDYSTTHKMHS